MRRTLHSRIIPDPLIAVLSNSVTAQDEESYAVKQIISAEVEKTVEIIRAEVEQAVEQPTATLLPEMLSQDTQPAVETASETSEEQMPQ